jgi:thioredoxin-dependent peroxiredoxin
MAKAMLNIGEKAPDFRLETDEGKEVSLSNFRSKRVLLYFYPKANTSG